MNTSFRQMRYRIALACLLVTTAIGAMGTGSGSIDASLVLASSKLPSVPLDNWASAQNISSDSANDTAPAIAVITNGAVTIAWERQATDHTYVVARSNTSLNGAFGSLRQLDVGGPGDVGRNVHAAADSLGRRYINWWSGSSSLACRAYARIDTDGTVGVNQTGECQGRKNVAIAVGTDNSVHMLFGSNESNIYYYRLSSSGTWDVQDELVTDSGAPKNITIGVTTGGQVMAAWVGNSGSRNDVFVSLRQGTNSWATPSNISSFVCGGSANYPAHLPNLARDPSGGMRIVWGQRQCPLVGPGFDEVYYREWTPSGGWGSNSDYANPSRQNAGDSYQPSVTVDYNGLAHIAWMDDTSRSRGKYRIYYSKGKLSDGFVDSGAIFPLSDTNAFQKEPSLGQNPPASGIPSTVHIAFSGNVSGNKEIYYSNSAGCGPGSYSDVDSSAYYYVPARELGIAGVMNGYADCTFRPNNTISRGQTAKIVVLGANRPIDIHGGPHFNDVSTTNVFYDYIETAFNDGIIGGYADGTFRPNTNVTRAQFSKMVVLGFQFPINTTGGPHFTDVPTSNAFYPYIETLVNRGLISGYNCGGPGEPCDPQNRSYFRPNSEITRGQAAKIIYGARQP